MSDSTSAYIFGEIFDRLAVIEESAARQELAEFIWDHVGYYDFSPYQMSADEALFLLGLAYKCEAGTIHYIGFDEEHDTICMEKH